MWSERSIQASRYKARQRKEMGKVLDRRSVDRDGMGAECVVETRWRAQLGNEVNDGRRGKTKKRRQYKCGTWLVVVNV